MEIITLSKGSYYIFLNQIYILEKIVGKSCYFRCYEKYCTGRVKELNDYITITKSHKCEARHGKIESMRLLKKFEARCTADEYGYDYVIKELYFKASDEAKVYLPTRTALIQRFKRMKGKSNVLDKESNSNSIMEDYNISILSSKPKMEPHVCDSIMEEVYPSKEDNEFLKSIKDAISGVNESFSSSNLISSIFQLKSTDYQFD